MAYLDMAQAFPKLQPDIVQLASELQRLILHIFPSARENQDGENIGYGFGTGYKNLVFVISPHRNHVNLGIVGGATLADPQGLMQGSGKVHRHVRLLRNEQLKDPVLKELMVRALRAAEDRIQGGA